MKRFYVNKNRQDSHDGLHNEVHEEGCFWLKQARDVKDLGYHLNCKSAMLVARIYYPDSADGCKVCCEDCHKG